MKLSKILLALAVLVLLASNGFLIYQNNRVKVKVDKLQANLITLQQSVQQSTKKLNSNISNTDSDVQQVCSSLSNC